MQRLYDIGADINIISRTAKDTPLHVAAANGSTEFIAEMLFLRADPSKPNAAGKTPFDVAAESGHEAAAALLRSHVKLPDASDLAKHLWPPGGPESGNPVPQAAWDKFKLSLSEHNVNSISRSYGVIHHLCCANQPHLIREILEQYGAARLATQPQHLPINSVLQAPTLISKRATRARPHCTLPPRRATFAALKCCWSWAAACVALITHGGRRSTLRRRLKSSRCSHRM